MPLTLNEAHFDDDLLNPLAHNADSFSFFSTSNSDFTVSDGKLHDCSDCQFKFSINVFMSGWTKIQQRTRYNCWDLLGDVGGFNDGLFLIGSLLMSMFSSFAYKKDYLDGTVIEGHQVRNLEKSSSFKQTLSDFYRVGHLSQTHLSIFK